MRLSIYDTHHSLTEVWRISEEGNTLGLEKKKTTVVGSASYYFGVLYLVLILSLRKLRGFLHLWFPQSKTLCSLSLVFDCCTCYSLSTDPNIMLA